MLALVFGQSWEQALRPFCHKEGPGTRVVELIKKGGHDSYMFEQRTHAPKLLSLLLLFDLSDAVLAVIDFVLAAIRFLPLPRGGVR
jgi:hypothetical protein